MWRDGVTIGMMLEKYEIIRGDELFEGIGGVRRVSGGENI